MNLETILQFFPPDLRDLVTAPNVSDVMINQDGRVYTDCEGRLEHHPDIELKPAQLLIGVQNIARLLGGDIDEANPILDSRLPDGSRVAALLSSGEMTVTIRKFTHWYTSDQLVEVGTLTPFLRGLLVSAIAESSNILIAGGTSSGKSTLAKALLDHAPETDRLIVIEKPRELAVSQPNAVRWEARDAVPGRPAITIAQLVVAALRHRPDRIVIGEVREPEAAYQLLQAMNTGHRGTLSTMHADSADDAVRRLIDLVLAGQPNLAGEGVARQIFRTIDYTVHLARGTDGKRRVTQVMRLAIDGKGTEVLYEQPKENQTNAIH